MKGGLPMTLESKGVKGKSNKREKKKKTVGKGEGGH